MAYYKVTEWGNGLYRITSAEAVFMDLIVGAEKALLIDTGWGMGDLSGAVRSITDKPLIVVNSHGHVDHVNGNFQFKNDILINPKDVELCKAHTSAPMRQYCCSMMEQMKILPENFDKEAFLKGDCGNLKPIDEGTVFDLGGKTLEVIELPGHTTGSIGLLYREEKILFVGDAINGALLLWGPESTSLNEYINTLEKAKNIDFKVMLQGHKEEPVDKSMLDTYIKVAKSVDWEKAQSYEKDGKANPDVRVMCKEGMTLANVNNPDFACIVISKGKL